MFRMESKILEVVNIKDKKSKAFLIGDLKVGDKIQLSINADTVGGNRGTYASHIKIENLETKEHTNKSFNQLFDLYRVVDLKELD